jgi:hypothetical protein
MTKEIDDDFEIVDEDNWIVVQPRENLKFDNPSHVWVIGYKVPADNDDVEEMTVYEYADRPLSTNDVLDEVRSSFSTFEDDKNKSLDELGIEIVSISREEC